MAKKKFTKKENLILSDVYRRLNYIHKGDLNTNLLYLGLPTDAKIIGKYNLIKPSSAETPRVLNWYNLTDTGKQFFSHYATTYKLDENTNHRIFVGTYVISFDFGLLEKINLELSEK